MKKLLLVLSLGLILAAGVTSCMSARGHSCYALKVGNHR